MANPKKFLVSAAVAAGLLGGGVVGIVLGAPGISGAHTTTVPDAPTTTVPDSGVTAPERPARGDRENCPEKEGDQAPTGASASNAGFRRVPGGRV